MTPPTPPTTRSSSRSSGCEPGAAFPPCLFSLFFPFPFTPFLAQTPTQPNPKPPNPVRVLAVSASCGRGLPFLPRFSPPANPANPPNPPLSSCAGSASSDRSTDSRCACASDQNPLWQLRIGLRHCIVPPRGLCRFVDHRLLDSLIFPSTHRRQKVSPRKPAVSARTLLPPSLSLPCHCHRNSLKTTTLLPCRCHPPRAPPRPGPSA